MDVELGKKVMEAIRFLDNHPVLCRGFNSTYKDSLDVWMYGVDHDGNLKSVYKGEWEKDNTVSFYKDQQDFDKYFDEFADEDQKKDKAEGKLDEFERLEVPYKTVYGKEWEAVKVEYVGELSYSICDWMTLKKQNKRVKLLEERRHFTSLGGESFHCNSYEELILKAAEHIKEKFGNCSLYDFHTKEEDEDKEPCFFSLPHKSGGHEIISNDRHHRTSDGELNWRFWKKYAETEKGKEFLAHYEIDLDGETLFNYEKCGFWMGHFYSIRNLLKHKFYNWKYRLTGKAGEPFL